LVDIYTTVNFTRCRWR